MLTVATKTTLNSLQNTFSPVIKAVFPEINAVFIYIAGMKYNVDRCKS